MGGIRPDMEIRKQEHSWEVRETLKEQLVSTRWYLNLKVPDPHVPLYLPSPPISIVLCCIHYSALQGTSTPVRHHAAKSGKP